MVHSEYKSAIRSILLPCGRALVGIAAGFIITGIILLAVIYANFYSYPNPDAFIISGGVLLGFGGLLLFAGTSVNSMDLMNEIAIKDVFGIFLSRFGQSQDSFALFKAIVNFSNASQVFREALNTEALLQLCYKYVRGRSRFVKRKLTDFIRSNNIIGFYTLVCGFVKIYHHSEYLPTLTKLLPDIIQHASYDFLQQYVQLLDILVWRDLQQKRHPFKYPSFFKPVALVKAMKLAYERGNSDMVLLLFNILAICVKKLRDGLVIDQVRTAITSKQKLNFTRNTGNVIQTNLDRGLWPEQLVLASFLDYKISPITPELYEMPIEEQPWFFGCYNPQVAEQIRSVISAVPFSMCIAFNGRLLVFRNKKMKLVMDAVEITTEDGFRSLPQTLKRLTKGAKYYMPNDGLVHRIEVFKFYKSIVCGDVQELKRIHQTTPLDWTFVLSNYRPYMVWLNSNNPKIEVIQCLYDLGVPIDDSWARWYDSLSRINEKKLESLKYFLLTHQPVNFGRLIDVTKLLEHRQFINISLFQKITDTYTPYDIHSINPLLDFILDSFPQIYRKFKIFSERKLLLLLAHKYGDGSSYFNTLPKELIRIIIDYLDEPPVSYQFVEILLKNDKHSLIQRHINFIDLCTKKLDRIILHYKWIRRIYFKLDEVPVESLRSLKHIRLYHFIKENETDPAFLANYSNLDNVSMMSDGDSDDYDECYY